MGGWVGGLRTYVRTNVPGVEVVDEAALHQFFV